MDDLGTMMITNAVKNPRSGATFSWMYHPKEVRREQFLAGELKSATESCRGDVSSIWSMYVGCEDLPGKPEFVSMAELTMTRLRQASLSETVSFLVASARFSCGSYVPQKADPGSRNG